MTRLISALAIVTILFTACQTETKTTWEISSPSKSVKAILYQTDAGQVMYEVKVDGKTSIEASPIGIAFAEEKFITGLTFVKTNATYNQQENYELVSGKKLMHSTIYNQMDFFFTNTNGKEIIVRTRVYNDGIAFSYELTGEGSYTLESEVTGFNLPEGKAWMHAYDSVVWWAPAYETYFENEIEIGTAAPWNKNGWAFPMLFNTDSVWTLITEANMDRGYVGMHLNTECTDGLYTMRLPEANEAFEVCNNTPAVSLPFSTPWRVIITSTSLGDVFESNLITDVSAPNKVEDLSWIKPGASSWSWWSENDSPKDYEALKRFVDFGAEMGWEYSLVDANWNIMKGGDLEKLAKYAATKDVGILVWYNSGGPNNIVTEQPRDLMNDTEKRRAEFKKLHDWGVKGIKVDFFQSDKVCIMTQYIDILEDAAEFEILVNFHGCTLPRGWRRTYPNLMTMEAVKGGEAYRFASDYPEVGIICNSILPFTRNVVGPMDYTPVMFTNTKYPHITSYAHELALSVVFESGIQHFADHYNGYVALPEFAKDFLKAVPTAWEESHYVDGYPGKTAVIARKSGDKIYVGGINSQNEETTISLDLSFLTEGDYTMEVIKDGETEKELTEESITVKSSGSTLTIPARGGFVGVISLK